MADQLRGSLVRIFTSGENNIAGAGFLVSDRHLLTCAHVIAEALNIPQSTPEIPTSTVNFDFPLVSPGTMLNAHVVYWQPVQRGKSPFMVEDIAVLELEDSKPLVGCKLKEFQGPATGYSQDLVVALCGINNLIA